MVERSALTSIMTQWFLHQHHGQAVHLHLAGWGLLQLQVVQRLTVLGTWRACGCGWVEEKGMKSVFTHRYLYALLPKCSNTFCHLSSVLQLSLEIDFFLSRCSWRNESMEWPRKRTCTVINLSCMHKFLQGLVLLAILVGSVFAGPAIVRHGLQPISFRKPVHDSIALISASCVCSSRRNPSTSWFTSLHVRRW